jgi:glycosyltransferase involved in cell wall biosynthesis
MASAAPIHVVILIGYLDLGGAERQALLLGEGLRLQFGWNAEVWGFEGEGIIPALCEERGIPFRRFARPNPRRLSRFLLPEWKLVRALRTSRPDVLIPFTVLPNVCGGFAASRAGVPMFLWNQRDEGRGLTGSWLERHVYAKASAVVSNSRHALEMLNSRFGNKEMCRIIRNGIETGSPQQSREEIRQDLAIPQDAMLFTMLANLHVHKDHATLIRSWAEFVKGADSSSVPSFLLLAGHHGPEYPALMKLATELGVENSIRMPGQLMDVAGVLAASDVAVHSSFKEGTPNAVMEAMAAGLPIIASRIPAIEEIVPPEQESLLFEPGNVADLVEKLLMARNQAERLGDHHARNREWARRNFSVKSMVDAYAVLIEGELQRIR